MIGHVIQGLSLVPDSVCVYMQCLHTCLSAYCDKLIRYSQFSTFSTIN